MKRIPRERLDAEIRLHQLANLNLIRNWVGQSTGEDFYELCDKYGHPGVGRVLPAQSARRPRSHRSRHLRGQRARQGSALPQPSFHRCCGARATRAIRRRRSTRLCASCWPKLEPTRRYQPSSTDGAGVRSHGPYYWRAPREFYTVTDDYFKTETGSVSVPTLESIHGMMPKKDWETINDDWAEHDLAKGNSARRYIPASSSPARYGKIANLADFVRKAQTGELRGLPRHVRGPQRAALPSHHGRHHLDEQSRAAQLRVADLPLRSGAEVIAISP